MRAGFEMINSLGRGEDLDNSLRNGLNKALSQEGLESSVRAGITGGTGHFGIIIRKSYFPDSYHEYEELEKQLKDNLLGK